MGEYAAARSQNGIGIWNGYGGDGGSGFVRVSLADTEVVRSAGRVGADNSEVGSGSEILVADSGGDEYGVACLHVDPGAVFASELDGGAAGETTENFVTVAVKVVVGKNSVNPALAPVVGVKVVSDFGRGAAGEGLRVDEQWQARIVRDGATRGKEIVFYVGCHRDRFTELRLVMQSNRGTG